MRYFRVAIVAGALFPLLSGAGIASAAMIPAIDDTFISQNQTPGNTAASSGDAEDNFGGRNEVIWGNNGSQPRHGLFRFDVSAVAQQINNGATVTSATFTLYERAARDGANGPNAPTTFDVHALVGANAGWVEGTGAGSAGGYSAQAGSVSYSYLAAPAAFGDGSGILWFSQGGGASGAGIPTPPVFQVGTDTGPSIGSLEFTQTAGVADVWTITLDAAAVQALLPGWLADPTGNPGLLLASAGNRQWFGASVEGDGTSPATPPATLSLEFVPEPSSLLLMTLVGVGLVAVGRRVSLR